MATIITWEAGKKKKGKRSGVQRRGRVFIRLLPVLMADKWSGTLTVEEKKADMDITTTPYLDPSTVAPGGSVTIKNVSIKNKGNVADTPHYKILQDSAVIADEDDSAGSLAAGNTRGKTFTFTASDYAGTYTITLKVWGKNYESEPS